jgi:hypothetical protein
MRQREGLIARVKQIRLTGAADDPRSSANLSRPQAAPTLSDLELRGLQDSVHREAVRHEGRLSDLEARTEPSALAVALSRDARERGL